MRLDDALDDCQPEADASVGADAFVAAKKGLDERGNSLSGEGLERIGERLSAARSGIGSVVTVAGDLRLGKTRLLEEAALTTEEKIEINSVV
ncbi:MAG: hypothetical protein JWL67_1948 [Solirubrobacterales bacterium]|nr:hypothetical protein [Solirubrobacterales bacterium]